MEGKASSTSGRILVVDQEQWCRDFLSAVMKLAGFEGFTLVDSVAGAFKALEESTFDLIITDLRLPEHHRLLDNCRSRFPSMYFILMVQQRAQTSQLVYLERTQVVFKPLSLDEIVRKIQRAIREKHRCQAEEEFRRLKQETFRILG